MYGHRIDFFVAIQRYRDFELRCTLLIDRNNNRFEFDYFYALYLISNGKKRTNTKYNTQTDRQIVIPSMIRHTISIVSNTRSQIFSTVVQRSTYARAVDLPSSRFKPRERDAKKHFNKNVFSRNARPPPKRERKNRMENLSKTIESEYTNLKREVRNIQPAIERAAQQQEVEEEELEQERQRNRRIWSKTPEDTKEIARTMLGNLRRKTRRKPAGHRLRSFNV